MPEFYDPDTSKRTFIRGALTATELDDPRYQYPPVGPLTVTGAPSGMSLSGDRLTGTPDTAGTGTVTVTATNASGTDSYSFAWEVTEPAPQPPNTPEPPSTTPVQLTGKFDSSRFIYMRLPDGTAALSDPYRVAVPAITSAVLQRGRVTVEISTNQGFAELPACVGRSGACWARFTASVVLGSVGIDVRALSLSHMHFVASQIGNTSWRVTVYPPGS